MAIQLGSAYGKVSLDASGVKNGADSAKNSLSSLDNSAKQMGATLRNIGAGLTLTVTTPLVMLAKNSLMSASALNEAKNKSKVVFGEMSADVLAWSETSAMAFGQSQLSAIGAAGTFGNLFTTMDIGKKQSAEFSMKLVELASDLSSFNDIPMDVALEKLRSGLVGEMEPLRTLGIRLTEDAVAAKALQMGLVQTNVDMVKVNGATLDLQEAQANLAKVQRGETVDADKLAAAQNRVGDAASRVADAEYAVTKAQERAARAQRDLDEMLKHDAKWKKEHALTIIHAQERVKDANDAIAQAQGRVANASSKVAEAQQKVNQVNRGVPANALDIAQAEQAVAEAEQKVTAALGGKNVALTDAQKLQARYALILEQSANAAGDFKRTQMDFANSLRTLQAVWGNASAKIGEVFLPLAIKVVHWLTKMIQKFNELTPFQRKMIVYFLVLVAVIGPLLMVFGTLLPLLHKTHSGFSLFSGGIFALIGNIVKWIGVAAMVVNVLEYFGIATGAVGAGIVGLSTAIGGVAATIFTSIILPILLVIAVVGLLYVAWKNNWFRIHDLTDRIGEWLKTFWKGVMQVLHGDTEEGAKTIVAQFEFIMDNLLKTFGRIPGFTAAWNSFLGWLLKAVTNARTYIVNAFSGTTWGTIGKNILFGIANGMLLGLPALLAIVVKVAGSVLTQIKKSLGISSPSKEAMKLGAFTSQGFMLGMQNAMDPEKMARSLAKPITGGGGNQSQTIVQNFASGLTLTQARQMISENNEQLMNTMINALGGA